jgi:hypothetical protein
MSNYTKSTNFTAKDSLPTGDTNKVIRGSEFDTEFDAIQTAVGTKSDLAGPTFTGTATFANLTATGTVNLTSATVSNLGTVTTADIDGGTIDGTIIGASSTAAISGTTGTFSGALSGTTGTFSGAVTGSNLNVSNWDTAFGWGNHASQGYLTSVAFSNIDAGAVTLSSETFLDVDNQIPTNAAVIDYVAATIPLITEVNDLTASVTWANVPDANITQSSVTQHQAALAIAASQLSDVTSTAAEINLLDGVTATTAEINYLDVTTLGTTEASKAVTADANGVVTFDNGISEEYTAVTSSSNATTVNLRDGTNFSHTLTENTTFTFSNPASSGKVSAFTLKIVQDASASGYTVTWPTSVDWPSATAPTLTATASAVDYFVFITHDGGTTYYGFTAGQALG